MQPLRLTVLALLLVFGGWRAWLALRSPEEKILARIERAEEGFNDTRLGPCMDLFARDFQDETSGFVHDDVKAALVSAFFRESGASAGGGDGSGSDLGKGFLYRIELEVDELVVEGAGARIVFDATLSERTSEGFREAWSFTVDGRLSEGPDGWKLASTTFRTTDGAIPK